MPSPTLGGTPLCLSTPGEALVVWSMRHWVESMRARLDPRCLIRQGFTAAGVETGADPFDAIMTTTLHEAISVRDVRRLRCPLIGAGERDMINAIAFEQSGHPSTSASVLAGWLPKHAVRAALTQVAQIGDGLRAAGMQLPIRVPESDGRSQAALRSLLH